MDGSPQQDAGTLKEVAIAETVVATPTEHSWTRVQAQVSRAVPRLRAIATQAILLGPIIGASTDFWGGGGSGRGC